MNEYMGQTRVRNSSTDRRSGLSVDIIVFMQNKLVFQKQAFREQQEVGTPTRR